MASAGSLVHRPGRRLLVQLKRSLALEVGEPPTLKRCDQLKVPVDKEGRSYQYCYPGNKVKPQMLSSVVVGYIWSARVCQETNLPGLNVGQPPAAVRVEPEPLPPVVQPFK